MREKELDCPVCHVPMDKVREVGVVIDVCDQHGVWLDDGELEAILGRVRVSQHPSPKQRKFQEYMAKRKPKKKHKKAHMLGMVFDALF